MEGLDIDVRTPSAGTSPPKVSTLASASSSSGGRIHQVGSFAVGTIHASEMRFPPLGEEHAVPSEDVEQRVEDALEDDNEEGWATFLEIEPRYRTTNRWLAES